MTEQVGGISSAEGCFLNPKREHGEPHLSGVGLLCPNPGESLIVGRLAKEAGWQRFFLYNSQGWRRPDGAAFVAGPAVGAPMAVMALEKLIAMGGQRFVAFGSCGALSVSLSVGDVVVPTWAVSQEGTSRHYPLPCPPEPAPLLREGLIDSVRRGGMVAHPGGVWTTDAPYRERRDAIRQFQSQGVVAVDMEFAALITVAAFRQVALASVMVVSDLLSGDVWQPGFRRKSFAQTMTAVARGLFDDLMRDRF